MFNCKVTCSRVVVGDVSTLVLSITSPVTGTTLSLAHENWDRCTSLLTHIRALSKYEETFSFNVMLTDEQMMMFYEAVNKDWPNFSKPKLDPPLVANTVPASAQVNFGLYVTGNLVLGEDSVYSPPLDPVVQVKSDGVYDVGSEYKRLRSVHSNNVITSNLEFKNPRISTNPYVSTLPGQMDQYLEIKIDNQTRYIKII